MFNTEKYNQGVRYRSRKALDQLKASLNTLGVGQTGELMSALKVNYKSSFGEIDAIGFTVTKGGVMTEKGVGRGSGIPVDSAKTNGASMTPRIKKPWFSSVIEPTVIELADYIATQKANKVTNQVNI